MTVKELKIAIIQGITSCDDPALLQTIHQMLQSLKDSPTDSVTLAPAQEVLNLLQKQNVTGDHPKGASSEDIQDLQDSIDEIFGKTR